MIGHNLTISGSFSVDTNNVSGILVTVNNVLNPSPAFTTSDFIGYIGTEFSGTGSYSYVVLSPTNFITC